MTAAMIHNLPILENSLENGLVFQGDCYCWKHQELLTRDFSTEEYYSCGFCEWGDPVL